MNAGGRCFELQDDMMIPGRWLLRWPVDEQGNKLKPWIYSEGKRIDSVTRIHFPVDPKGVALDFSLDSHGVPVIHARVKPLLDPYVLNGEIQLLPVTVEDHDEPYFIINTLRTIRCIDDARCTEVGYWLPEDNRPDKEGQYRGVIGLKVAPSRIDADIFRPWGWTVVLIVSERVKLAMEGAGITGTQFTEA